jgi:hypothetical protein
MLQATLIFRRHRLIHYYEWTSKLEPRYTETLQQKFINTETQEESWVAVPIIEEEVPNCISYM